MRSFKASFFAVTETLVSGLNPANPESRCIPDATQPRPRCVRALPSNRGTLSPACTASCGINKDTSSSGLSDIWSVRAARYRAMFPIVGLRFTTKFYEGKIKEMHSARELSFRNDAVHWAYMCFVLIINHRMIQYCLFYRVLLFLARLVPCELKPEINQMNCWSVYRPQEGAMLLPLHCALSGHRTPYCCLLIIYVYSRSDLCDLRFLKLVCMILSLFIKKMRFWKT